MEGLNQLIDESHDGVRVGFGMARVELELKASIRATAAMYLAVHDVLREAREHPENFVRSEYLADPDAVEFALRGAALDLAARMSLSENSVRAFDHLVETLRLRAPRVLALFCEGDIAVANVRVVADLSSTVSAESWTAFDAAAVDSMRLTPAKFKTRMRAARERLQPDAAERHRTALEERRVWLDRDLDGMSDLVINGPAAACERAQANVDRLARELASDADETRTLAQLRADVALDLLAGKLGSGTGVGIAVRLTIPVMTMLGHSDEPALLQGYGPIDAETARELAKDAPSFTRILTHPITGAIIDVDNPGYRPTTSQDRAVKARDEQCRGVGCTKRAEDCDLDHTVPWPRGSTTYDNLKALCRSHHRVKHKTLWESQQDADGNTIWTSPTGFVRPADPPPF